jgi:hypothetical protein
MVALLIAGRADIVFGSRLLSGQNRLPPVKKYFILPAAKIFNRLIFRINPGDPQSGFRAMNRRAARMITIEQDGSAHCSEILIKAHRLPLKVAEVPVAVHYRDFGQGLFKGKGRGSGGLRIIKDLLLAKFHN